MSKIAICISGQTRMWRSSYNSFKNNLLDKLPYPYDIFVSTWEPSDEIQSDLNSGWRYNDEGSLKEFQALYNPLFVSVESYNREKDNFFIELEKRSGLSRSDNYPRRLFAMWYKVQKCFNFLKWADNSYWEENGYDIIIRTRSDLEYGNNFNPKWLDSLDKGIIIDHYGNGKSPIACGDVFAIGTMDQMEYYCSMFDVMMDYFETGKASECQTLIDHHIGQINHQVIHFIKNVYRPKIWKD